ncbi:MAG: hypothetical protein JNM07_10770 [Phycisphaerae bacterium]|nr:hypothetical protein [Phycisphaerae bacterium]
MSSANAPVQPPVPGEAMEHVAFLIEQAHAASNLYWTRTNVFLSIQTFSLAGVIAWLGGNHPPAFWVVLALAVLGFVFCAIWFHVNRMSRYYHDVFVRDARRAAVAAGKVGLVYFSLGFAEQKGFRVEEGPKPNSFLFLNRPKGPSATRCMYGVIVLFAAAWAVVGVLGWAVAHP